MPPFDEPVYEGGHDSGKLLVRRIRVAKHRSGREGRGIELAYAPDGRFALYTCRHLKAHLGFVPEVDIAATAASH